METFLVSYLLGNSYALVTRPTGYGEAAPDHLIRSRIAQQWHSLRELFLALRSEPSPPADPAQQS